MTRYALVTLTWERDNPEPYMPGNYEVVRIDPHPEKPDWRVALVKGQDAFGWTLDDYVLPRLASGGMVGREITPAEAEALALAREVRNEEAMNADLIERHNLRGIVPPEY